MPACATGGATLRALARIMIPIAQEAERSCPRRGPGRKPLIPDWAIITMIVVAVLHLKKSKSAQFTFWEQRPTLFQELMPGVRLPARSTFFDRYRRLGPVAAAAVERAGQEAIRRGWADPECVACDKSLIAARGRPPRAKDKRRGRRTPGCDAQGAWGYSGHDGWVWGYSWERLGTAPREGVNWPLLASVDAADRNEQRSFLEKVPRLPQRTRFVLLDAGYDSNAVAEAVEWDWPGRRSGRRVLCPEVRRPNVGRPRKQKKESKTRRRHRRLRAARKRFFDSPRGRRLYGRRKCTAEPLNERIKSLFELHDRAWHRGLENNRTQLSSAIFAYQVLLLYNHHEGAHHACVKCTLNRL